MTELETGEIANALHDALLRVIARMAPVGGDRTMPVNAIADALVTLLAEVLIASQPGLPADEPDRLEMLFKTRLQEAIAERAQPIGHA